MPIDTKRNPRPEHSEPYQQLEGTATGAATSCQSADVSSWKRSGDRKHHDPRPMYLRLGTIVHAQGSAYLELGDCKVTAAVYGPRSSSRRSAAAADFSSTGQLSCELKFASFSGVTRRQPVPDNQERELSQTLRTALEPSVCLHEFPKLNVDVFVYILEDGGGALAAAIIAASSALADARVPLYDMVAAASMFHHGGASLVDPSSEELTALCQQTADCSGHVTIGFMSQLQQVTGLYSEGVMGCDVIDQAVSTLISVCRDVHAVMRDTVLTAISQPKENGAS